MKLIRPLLTALVCAGVSACSGGSITGKVTVEGGSASGIAVFAYGPSSGATVTGGDGAFTLSGVNDGDYVVRATVRGTDEVEQSAAVTVKNGKAEGDVTLAFRFSSATVTGHVVFSDGSDATGLSVVATGAETKSVVTEAGGAFTLSNLKTGAYVVSVEAPSTREGRVSIGVNAGGAVDVGELRLTPVGRLTGTVTFNGAPAVGVPVMVSGTGVSAVSDAAGAFELVNVPTGARTVWARTGEAPFWRSGSVDVTVTRGENAAVALTLSDDPPKTGTVNGVVTFSSANDPTNITVSVDGLDVSTAVGVNGGFSLSVPVGSWDIVAKAPSYPKQVLGHVVIHEGQTSSLPGQRLSWYRPIWTIPEAVTSLTTFGASQSVKAYQLLSISSYGNVGFERLALLDVETGDLRFLAANGSYEDPIISSTGKYVAWSYASSVFLYSVVSGSLSIVPLPSSALTFRFSSDETVLFVYLGGSLRRIPTGAPTNVQRFPADGGSTAVFSFGDDRWFTQEALGAGIYRVMQISPGAEQTIDLESGAAAPVLFGIADAGASYSLTLVPYDAGTPVSAGTLPFGTFVSAIGGTVSVPCFSTNGAEQSWFCVKMSDGSRVALPSDTAGVVVNELGTRMAFITQPSDGGPTGFFESALPPTGVISPIDTSNAGWEYSWLSPSRVVAVESGIADGRKLRVVSNGTAAPVDLDTADGGVEVYGPLLLTRQKSTGKWRAMLGDGPFRTLPVDAGVPPASAMGVRTTSPVTKYAAVSFGSSEQWSWVVDENANSVSALPSAAGCFGAWRSGTFEFTPCDRPGIAANSPPYDFGRKVWLDLQEEQFYGYAPRDVGNEAVRKGRVEVSSEGHSILLGTYGD